LLTEFQFNLSAKEIGRIVNFLGYGRLSAPVWFIGIEEGLAKMDSGDAVKNLTARATFATVMDLREAHLRLLEKGKPIDMEVNPPYTQVWDYMAKIMRAYNGNKDWRNLESAREYIRSRLGRSDADTFLTELSPIPAGNTTDKQWMSLFKKLDPGLERKIEQRRRKLKRVLRCVSPPLVICYGKRADDFSELLSVDWHSVSVSSKVRKSQDSKRLLLPFLGVGQMSHSVIEELLGLGFFNNKPGFVEHVCQVSCCPFLRTSDVSLLSQNLFGISGIREPSRLDVLRR
jgi:hypothetical protein